MANNFWIGSPKRFQTCTNCLGHGSKSKIQNRNVIFGPVKTDLDRPILIWAGPEQFGLIQNNFGLIIGGQGTNQFFYNHFEPPHRHLFRAWRHQFYTPNFEIVYPSSVPSAPSKKFDVIFGHPILKSCYLSLGSNCG